MSDQPADSDATSTTQPEAWSPNGTHDGTHDVPDAAVEPGEPTEAAATDQPVAGDPEQQDDAAVAASAGADGAEAGADDPEAFLNELVRAMRTTAAAERGRIGIDTDRRREEHLASIETRRKSEADRIRELADGDLKAIDAWADDERQRIDAERARRAEALAADLKTSLAEHGTRIDGEVERAEATITAYRAQVDAFFAVLETETDPVAIAQHAGRKPSFPDLDQATTSDATADAGDATPPAGEESEPAAPVGVMDQEPGARLAASFAAWNAGTSVAAVPAATEAATNEVPTEDAQTEATPAPVAVAHGPHDNGPGTVLHAVPSGRPLSWLRRDRDGSDDSGGDRQAG